MSLKLIKLTLKSVLSRPGAKFACFDVKNFYLATPTDRSEYARIKIENTPQEFIKEYNLLPMVHNGWIYFEIVRGCHGLPQSGILANKLLHKCLNKKKDISKQRPPWDYVSTNGDPSSSI